jgi:nicotinamide phosphoribosyltransferase
MYDPKIKKLVSYYAIRGSRMPSDKNYVVNFGVQSFCKEFLTEFWDENFFKLDWKVLDESLKEYYKKTFAPNDDFVEKLKDLHSLGHLPLRIYTVPEGGICDIKTPIIMMETTDPRFPWIGEFIESLISSYIWKMNLDATVGHWYRRIVDKYYDLTCEDSIPRNMAMSEFQFRGASGPECGVRSGAAWLLSFKANATAAGVPFMQEYYGAKLSDGKGSPSTEHSVMCSSFAIDGDEETLIRRLLTEVYPHDNFTMVSDSYDYWNLVKNILPNVKNLIMNRKKLDGSPAKLLIRGDSGDPVKIIAGYLPIDTTDYESEEEANKYLSTSTSNLIVDLNPEIIIDTEDDCVIRVKGVYHRIKYSDNTDSYVVGDEISDEEVRGTVELLWDLFGGSINSKGYMVLDPHIGMIYGDSITVTRAEYIYKVLEIKGFAACNVALGAGSFSFHCLETEEGQLLPFTRDSYNAAIKATYAETEEGTPIMIFKDPKTDTGKFKKSLRGCCQVGYDQDTHRYHLVRDGLTLEEFKNLPSNENMYRVVFENGKMITTWNLTEIREILYHGKF